MNASTDTMIQMKAATLGLIKRIEREGMTDKPASEVYTTLADYMRETYRELTNEEIDHCVYYAMQACLF